MVNYVVFYVYAELILFHFLPGELMIKEEIFVVHSSENVLNTPSLQGNNAG